MMRINAVRWLMVRPGRRAQARVSASRPGKQLGSRGFGRGILSSHEPGLMRGPTSRMKALVTLFPGRNKRDLQLYSAG